MKKVLLFSGLCGLSALLLLARSPGGVEGVDAWFKAAPVSGNPLSLNSHSDSVGYSKRNDNQHLLYDYQKNNVYYWHGV